MPTLRTGEEQVVRKIWSVSGANMHTHREGHSSNFFVPHNQ